MEQSKNTIAELLFFANHKAIEKWNVTSKAFSYDTEPRITLGTYLRAVTDVRHSLQLACRFGTLVVWEDNGDNNLSLDNRFVRSLSKISVKAAHIVLQDSEWRSAATQNPV